MEILYGNRKVESYCNSEKIAQKMFNLKIANELFKLMDRLRALPHIGIFSTHGALKKYHYHKLHDETGKPKERWALRLDYGYRMTIVVIKISEGDDEDTIKILEVTNHYGD